MKAAIVFITSFATVTGIFSWLVPLDLDASKKALAWWAALLISIVLAMAYLAQQEAEEAARQEIQAQTNAKLQVVINLLQERMSDAAATQLGLPGPIVAKAGSAGELSATIG